jgi:hypothetical protein
MHLCGLLCDQTPVDGRCPVSGDALEWRQLSAREFVRGAEKHVCAGECRLATVRLGGLECCPVSRMQMGAPIDAEEAEVDAAPAKRARLSDPLEHSGIGYRRAAEAIYRKLFAANLAEAGLEHELRLALKKAKDAKVDIQREGRAIAERVKQDHISFDELAPTTEIAGAIMRVLPDADFDAVLCAVLGYQSTHGLRCADTVVIAPHAKIARLLPSTRSFTSYGVKASLVKNGMNAIAGATGQLAQLGPVRVTKLPAPFDLAAPMKRIKL